jgi:hypothetical protein
LIRVTAPVRVEHELGRVDHDRLRFAVLSGQNGHHPGKNVLVSQKEISHKFTACFLNRETRHLSNTDWFCSWPWN